YLLACSKFHLQKQKITNSNIYNIKKKNKNQEKQVKKPPFPREKTEPPPNNTRAGLKECQKPLALCFQLCYTV
ncbi:MAG: hypothetical protein IJL25_08880, partial [Clostridia bacterium]|nr:hypothetical protein [Clostridia bacterium]